MLRKSNSKLPHTNMFSVKKVSPVGELENKTKAQKLLAYIDRADYEKIESTWRKNPELMLQTVLGENEMLTTPLKHALYNLDTWAWKPFYIWLDKNRPDLMPIFLMQILQQNTYVDEIDLPPLYAAYENLKNQVIKWSHNEVVDSELSKAWVRVASLQRQKLPWSMLRAMCQTGNSWWSPISDFASPKAPKSGEVFSVRGGVHVKLDSQRFLEEFGAVFGIQHTGSLGAVAVERVVSTVLDMDIAHDYNADAQTMKQFCKIGRAEIAELTMTSKLTTLKQFDQLDVVNVVATSYGNFFLTKDGQVYACGENQWDQQGRQKPQTQLAPLHRMEFPQDTRITQISAGWESTLFLTDDGRVFGCGRNDGSTLTLPEEIVTVPQPVQLKGLIENVEIKQIFCGGYSLFLAKNGRVYGCGSNSDGQLAVANLEHQTALIELTDFPLGIKITQIAGGACHTLFLTQDGEVFGCGSNEDGQLGCADAKQIPSIVKLTGFPAKCKIVKIVADHAFNSFFITDDGKVYGCGTNKSNQMGLADTSNQKSIISITGFPQGTEIIDVASGGHYTLFLSRSGEVFGCGYNGARQLGIDVPEQPNIVPLTGFPTSVKIKCVGAGQRHAMFLSDAGDLYGCGENEWQQLVTGNSKGRHGLHLIPINEEIRQLASEEYRVNSIRLTQFDAAKKLLSHVDEDRQHVSAVMLK